MQSRNKMTDKMQLPTQKQLWDFSKALWLKGYYYVVEQLEPILILRYGPKIKGEHEELSMYLENEQLNIVRHGCKRK
jgi:hypothetical protein